VDKPTIHLIRYVGNHPVASVSPDRVFEVSKMENSVVVNVNKHAKKDDGEGPQIQVSVGDRLSREQAVQLSRQYATTLVSVTSS
jgi:co-chaperonin GroES (HSP10)